MSRSRKDDNRYQSPSGPGLQSSPSREPHSGAAGFLSPVASGHNYMRSKVKDRDRSGYLAKDRVKNTNPGDNPERYFAPAKQASFRSPPPNSFPCSNDVALGRELSWADEVELTMSNNSSQRTDANANTGGTTPKMPKSLEQGQMTKSPEQGQMTKTLEQGQMTKSLEQGQMIKSLEHNIVEAKSSVQPSNSNQRPVDEKVAKMLPKNTGVQPTAMFSNGKTKPNYDKEHDPASFKRANCPQLRRGSRKKTLSLNPEEREALESLIEEVLMDGAIDSESASSEEETEQSDAWKNANAELSGSGANAGAGGEGMHKARGDKGKMGRKYYPGQLKVALKHMTELPPRFSRKLKKAEKYLELNQMRAANSTTGRIEEEDEESVALARDDKRMSLSPRPQEREKEKAKSKEHHVKEFKRSIRTLLTDLDQYVDEKSVLSNSSSATSIHPPGAIICEDLERESLTRQHLQSSDMTHEVPSTVQNLLLAAKGYTSMAGNQSGTPQEVYQEQYLENESVSSGTNLAGKSFTGTELASQQYARPYTVQEAADGSQFMVNVPEFVPKGMVVTSYQPQEMLSPAEHHHYPASLIPELSPGSMSGNVNDPGPRHGMTPDQLVIMGQGSPLMNASSAPAQPLSSTMMDFSNSLVSLPPTLGTQGGSMGEKMLSPMPPVFVSSGMPLSNLPSPGSLPFYQFQTQNPPPPSTSYNFPVQVPYSSNQYCYMPPALPPQSLPLPYYPRDQVQFADGGMQFKTMVPDWGYQKPKHYSNSVSTLPTYSGFSNQTTALPLYPGSEQGAPGMNHLNFRQRKKQPGSSLSPRNVGSMSSNMSAGKLSLQRTRGNEGPSASNRLSLRPGQENTDSYPYPDANMTMPTYGDAAMKRLPFTMRSRGSADGQSGYPGRRENRNFVSEKYAVPRTLAGDGKKEARHVTLKPKQSKPNRSLGRSRNDPTVAQLHPLKAYHPSDLSEEGLESPDNFGDVESGADDWSTDNYDMEVSKKGKEAVENKDVLKDVHCAREDNIQSMISTCAADEIKALRSGEKQPSAVPDDTCISDYGLGNSPECFTENCSAGDTSQVNSLMPECNSLELAVSEPSASVPDACSVAEDVQHSSLEVQSGKTCVSHVTEDSQLQLEIDRSILSSENVKRVAVLKKIRVSLADLQVGSDVASARPSVPSPKVVELVAERDSPSLGDRSEESVCELSSEPPVIVKVSAEGIHGQVELSGHGLADIDVPGEGDAEGTCRSELEGMNVILGSNFISQLVNMFKPGQCTDSLSKLSPEAVHLSQAVLNQIYLEYVAQDRNSGDCQSYTRSSAEDVSNRPVMDASPESLDTNLSSPSVNEKSSDTVTGCSTHQQQLCDTSCHHDSTSDDCRAEDVVLDSHTESTHYAH